MDKKALTNYYKSKIDEEIINRLRNQNERILNIQYDNCFKLILNFKFELLNTLKYQIINFDELIDNTSTHNDKPLPIIQELFSKLLSWYFSSLIGSLYLGADLLLELAYTLFKYKLSQRETELILGNLKPYHKKRKEYKKVKKIIIVRDINALNDDQTNLLNFIEYLIHEKYICNALLIKTSSLPFEDINYKFILDLNEIRTIFKFTLINKNNIEIFKNLDIDFFPMFYACLQNNKALSNEELFKKIIFNIITNSKTKIAKQDLYNFFKLCSYLFPFFSQRDLENNFNKLLSNIVLYLNDGKKTNILESTDKGYYFTEIYIRNFFLNGVPNMLDSTQKDNLYKYLQTTYPTQYFNLAIASIKLNQPTSEIYSRILIAYYYKDELANDEKSILIKQINKEYNTKLFTYIDNIEKNININLNIRLLLISNDYSCLTIAGKLSCLGIILPKAYEFFGEENINIFNQYEEILNYSKLFSNQSNHFYPYIIDFIILSTAIELDQRQSNIINRLTALIESNQEEISKKYKLKFLRLSNLISSDPEKLLKYAFDITINNKIEHEIFRTNYSVSLLFSSKYEKALSLFEDKDKILMKSINEDIYISLENNKYVTKSLLYQTKRNPFKRILKQISINNQNSDWFIIKNNQIAHDILLGNKNLEKNIKLINEIEQSQDCFHIFFLQYNLLTHAYINKNIDLFDELYQKIKVPTLLKDYKDYFADRLNKLNSLKEKKIFMNTHALKKEFELIDERYETLRIGHFKEIVLFGLIERWYE